MFEIYGPPLKYFISPTKIIIDIICLYLKEGPNISAEIIDPLSIYYPFSLLRKYWPSIIILPGPSPPEQCSVEIIMDQRGVPIFQLK